MAEPIFKQAEVGDLKIIRKNGQDVEPPAEPVPPAGQDDPDKLETEEEEQTPPAEATPPAEETPKEEEKEEEIEQPSAEGDDTPTDQPQGLTDEEQRVMGEFLDYASEQTGGKINSVQDILALHEENNQLRTQLAEKPKIEFPNDQAKAIYDYACKFPGLEKAAARNYLHVMSLDVKGMSDKEKQFEAFALENHKLPREEAREFFEALYEKNFGNGQLEDDRVAKYNHRIQTDKAEETIKKMQEDFEKLSSKPADSQNAAAQAQQLSADDQRIVEENVQSILDDFEGVAYQFFDKDPQSVVNIPLKREELQKFGEILRNPNQLLQGIMAECTVNGKFDWDKYAITMYEIMYRNAIREQTYKAGNTYGEARKIREYKNTPQRKAEAPPIQKKKEPKTLGEAMVNAYQAKWGTPKKKV